MELSHPTELLSKQAHTGLACVCLFVCSFGMLDKNSALELYPHPKAYSLNSEKTLYSLIRLNAPVLF